MISSCLVSSSPVSNILDQEGASPSLTSIFRTVSQIEVLVGLLSNHSFPTPTYLPPSGAAQGAPTFYYLNSPAIGAELSKGWYGW